MSVDSEFSGPEPQDCAVVCTTHLTQYQCRSIPPTVTESDPGSSPLRWRRQSTDRQSANAGPAADGQRPDGQRHAEFAKPSGGYPRCKSPCIYVYRAQTSRWPKAGRNLTGRRLITWFLNVRSWPGPARRRALFLASRRLWSAENKPVPFPKRKVIGILAPQSG